MVSIIGLLMAVALPRIAELQAPARQSQLKTAVGALRSASALFHAQCLARQASERAQRCTSLTIEGAAIEGVNGYPAATLQGIAAMAGLRADSAGESGFLLTVRSELVPRALQIEIPGATPGGCRLLYSEAAGPGAAPAIEVISAPCN